MADTTINIAGLPAATVLNGEEVLPVVQGNITKQATVNEINAYIVVNFGGGTSIVTVGTVTTGTWNATTIAINKGGTGATTAATALSNLGGLSTVTATATYAPIASPTLTGIPAAPTAAGGTNTTQLATTAFVQTAVAGAAPPTLYGVLYGLTLSNDAGSPNTVLDIASGVTLSSDSTTLMNLASAYTKTTGAWAVGSGSGGLDTGAAANNTWYHVYVIKRTDTNVVDILFSTSATAPTMPASYTKKRRIGSFKTNGSAQIILFYQSGDTFLWGTPTQDVNANPVGDTVAHTGVLNVPLGVVVMAMIIVGISNSVDGFANLYISNLSQADLAASSSADTVNCLGTTVVPVANIQVLTNTSQSIRYRASELNTKMTLNTNGWVDTRGRLS